MEIKNHELTAAGTYYTANKSNGETEKNNQCILIKFHANQVKKYQEQVELQQKQLCLQGKQLPRPDQPNQKEDSIEADDKTYGQSNQKENSIEAGDKTLGKSNQKEHSSEEDDQDLEVSKILRHQTKNGEVNYLLQFTDGTKDYTAEKEEKIDCPQILKEYKKKHGLEGDNTKKEKEKNNYSIQICQKNLHVYG